MNIVKRQGRYGTPDDLTDQATVDILAAVNVRGARIWGARDWKWQREALSFAMVAGTKAYTVAAASANPIDRILHLIPDGSTMSPPQDADPLDQMEIGAFYRQSSVIATPGVPKKYCNIGMDANGSWQIIVSPTPSSAFTMKGYAKAVLVTYTQADVVANSAIKYFPNGVVLDSLLAGCLISVGRIQGMTPETALAAEQAWESKIKSLGAEQIGADKDNTPITSPLPDYITRRIGSRGRGTST